MQRSAAMLQACFNTIDRHKVWWQYSNLLLYNGQLSTVIKYDGNTAIFHQYEDIGTSVQASQEIAVSANSMEKEAEPQQSGGWDDYPLGSW